MTAVTAAIEQFRRSGDGLMLTQFEIRDVLRDAAFEDQAHRLKLCKADERIEVVRTNIDRLVADLRDIPT